MSDGARGEGKCEDEGEPPEATAYKGGEHEGEDLDDGDEGESLGKGGDGEDEKDEKEHEENKGENKEHEEHQNAGDNPGNQPPGNENVGHPDEQPQDASNKMPIPCPIKDKIGDGQDKSPINDGDPVGDKIDDELKGGDKAGEEAGKLSEILNGLTEIIKDILGGKYGQVDTDAKAAGVEGGGQERMGWWGEGASCRLLGGLVL